MGGTSKSSQTQTQSLAPYDPAAGSLKGILGGLGGMVGSAGINPTQTGALNSIEANTGAASSTFGQPAVNGTLGLLNGGGAQANDAAIRGNLANYASNIGSTASGANIGNNPALKAQLDQIATDTSNQVNGMWAASGRDGSPGNAQALARGIAAGQAPVIANQYNQDVANHLNAANSLYGAGNQTYGLLNGNQAQANQNFTNGIGTAGNALDLQNAGANGALQAEAQRFGIPTSQYATLLGSIAPVAAQFGTQNGRSEGSQTMSGAQQFATIMQGIGSLWPKGNISFGAA